MSQLYAVASRGSNSASLSCDCLAHVYGIASAAAGSLPRFGRPGYGAEGGDHRRAVFDAGKKVNGRKRHIVVDTFGLLLAVTVTAASVIDRDAGRELLARLRRRHWRITRVWADGGYTGQLVDVARRRLHLALAVVKRSDDVAGFVVLPKRWLVERTFAWLMRSRRLARDYEARTDSVEAMVWWSMSMVISRRLARPRGLNIPGTASVSQPRRARRLAFECTPSTFAGTTARPSAAANFRQSVASPPSLARMATIRR